ncbi:helix-turn-helix domain-containing GNAT family N-acetyltransferase [Cypionkella sp.]|uniref:bifunctional helix-turn-helix transcriptional regulator/GNAT family N-acetyltransferase n=1 Tax=Cypionkella sp. TaxID=2811411 RepID=UPI002ABCE4AD|nr:helix-turn-helix domain-containing GNAT family N-acetyltransferase [Cypionkella sp.]MDZ4394742.1 helix-turn-helix domain-containing GNAT family N-acetyltransferase [Cypionkella sp.]
MTNAASADSVESIRRAARLLVRELGFMGGDFAGGDLSPSAVHALIEIEAGGVAGVGVTARDLGLRLHLEKSSVSRMLRKLVAGGDVVEQAAEDGRVKALALTEAGQRRVAGIHAFARAQVVAALARMQPGQDRVVLEGLQLYAEALGASAPAPPAIEIVAGYRTGLIARITQMHAHYYAQHSGFGQRFEAVVAGGLAGFSDRLDSPRNAIWAALRGGEIVGSIAIDGEDLGGNLAHLRWFITDAAVQGSGAGRRLLAAALGFVDAQGVEATHLWTFSGLSAARHLYEAHGFALVEERPGQRWGREVLEQKFVRRGR